MKTAAKILRPREIANDSFTDRCPDVADMVFSFAEVMFVKKGMSHRLLGVTALRTPWFEKQYLAWFIHSS